MLKKTHVGDVLLADPLCTFKQCLSGPLFMMLVKNNKRHRAGKIFEKACGPDLSFPQVIKGKQMMDENLHKIKIITKLSFYIFSVRLMGLL